MIHTNAKRRVERRGRAFAVTGDDRFWDVFENGWNEETFLALDACLHPESVYVEIGAWVGPTVLYAAQTAERVYAFEPDPKAFGRMEANLALNPDLASKVTTFAAGLGPYKGNMVLFSDQFGGSRSSIYPVAPSSAGAPQGADRGQTAQRSLEAPVLDARTILSDLVSGPQDCIRLDVEGAEYSILANLRPLLQERKPTVYAEFNPFRVCVAEDDDYAAELRRHLYGLEALECFVEHRYVYHFQEGVWTPFRDKNNLLRRALGAKHGLTGPLIFSDREL